MAAARNEAVNTDLRTKLLGLGFSAKAKTEVKTDFVPVPSDNQGGLAKKRVSINEQRRALIAKATEAECKPLPKPQGKTKQRRDRGPKRASVQARATKPSNAAPPRRTTKRYDPASAQDEVVSASFDQVVAFFAGRSKLSERMRQSASELLEGREDRRFLFRRAKQSLAKCEIKGNSGMLAVTTGEVKDDLSGGIDFFDVRMIHKIEYVTSGDNPITYIFIREGKAFRRIRKQR